ncbi:MAG: transcription termination factor NusA [Planctomycetaceae bacterium]|jgi:N utilization substance protein A|nr:transcription termination factor NusA [Planctomycetaceae bacterium]
MNPSEVLRIVDAIHRDKRIAKEIVFVGIEAAIATAVRRQYGDEAVVKIQVNRETGEITGSCNDEPIATSELAERIGAQNAKQVMIQKIREAERDAIFDENYSQINQLVSGSVDKIEGSNVIISLPGVVAILPRSERIPGESFRIGDRIRAVVTDVVKKGNRVNVMLSRIRPSFVQKLFEQEIPEIQDAIIETKGVSREPGCRTKIAVYSSDQRVDCVGACIGMRGNRIKNITDELNNERIDVVPWNADLQIYIQEALKPAIIEEVILCSMLGRAIVLVKQDNRSLAIGRRGQNVRLASRLVGWDIEIMTREDLEDLLEKAVEGYMLIEGITNDIADRLVGEGFLSFDDLSIIEPDDLVQIGEITMDQAVSIIQQAEEFAQKEEDFKLQPRANEDENKSQEENVEDE